MVKMHCKCHLITRGYMACEAIIVCPKPLVVQLALSGVLKVTDFHIPVYML